MPIEQRLPPQQNKLGAGPFLAKVVSHLDPTYMGSLEVTLLKKQGNTQADDTQTYIVRYAPPFYGVTGYAFQGSNKEDFNDTQKSYGMWFIPPDVGVTVLVVFVDGNAAEGYWIGCVPEKFANHMIPGISAFDAIEASQADKQKYDSGFLPTGEINRITNDLKEGPELEKIKKTIHPFADRLLEQGLILDTDRGVTTSSARREVPSNVFGLSTPGPLDKRPGAKRATVGKRDTKSPKPVPVSRLGGTQFVMDDGDERYQRKKPASEGPSEYADIQAGEKGDPTLPFGEHFRIRTRTGHQILFHNSEDLIYIANARGTAWIELSSDGKIDIFAADTISVHTRTDINLRADRDINIEAGRNINMKATADYSKFADKDDKGFDSGRIQIESKFDTNVIINRDGKITTTRNFDLNTGEINCFTAGKTSHINSVDGHYETAKVIHMNGPTATVAKKAEKLKLHKIYVTDEKLSWKDKKYQVDDPFESIVKRVPMHEPWPGHENFSPEFLKPEFTDREKDGE